MSSAAGPAPPEAAAWPEANAGYGGAAAARGVAPWDAPPPLGAYRRAALEAAPALRALDALGLEILRPEHQAGVAAACLEVVAALRRQPRHLNRQADARARGLALVLEGPGGGADGAPGGEAWGVRTAEDLLYRELVGLHDASMALLRDAGVPASVRGVLGYITILIKESVHELVAEALPGYRGLLADCAVAVAALAAGEDPFAGGAFAAGGGGGDGGEGGGGAGGGGGEGGGGEGGGGEGGPPPAGAPPAAGGRPAPPVLAARFPPMPRGAKSAPGGGPFAEEVVEEGQRARFHAWLRGGPLPPPRPAPVAGWDGRPRPAAPGRAPAAG